MKVFISWSGSPSGEIAEQLRDWLPLILPAAKPFITRADINKGANWPGAIRHELEQSHYGIVCLTGGNVSSAWLAFEAGALSKQLESRVATVLFGLNHNEVPLPLGMFQGTSFNETDMRLLINSMNTAADLEERRSEKDLDKVFSRFWPDLNDPVTSILSAHASEEPPREIDAAEMTAQIMALLRQQTEVLSSPEKLLDPVLHSLKRLEAIVLAGPYAARVPGLLDSPQQQKSGSIVDVAGDRALPWQTGSNLPFESGSAGRDDPTRKK
jgi:hypothetical protein